MSLSFSGVNGIFVSLILFGVPEILSTIRRTYQRLLVQRYDSHQEARQHQYVQWSQSHKTSLFFSVYTHLFSITFNNWDWPYNFAFNPLNCGSTVLCKWIGSTMKLCITNTEYTTANSTSVNTKNNIHHSIVVEYCFQLYTFVSSYYCYSLYHSWVIIH